MNFVGGNTFDLSMPARGGATATPTLDGGALLVNQTNVQTDRVRFTNNTSNQDGGAVELGSVGVAGGTHVFANATVFDGNTAKGRGGAVSADGAGDVLFTNTVITNNTSDKGAAGVQAFTNSVTFDRSRLEGNTGDAGAASVLGSVFVNNTLVKNNTALGVATAGIAASVSGITITNSTFVGNTSTGGLTGGSAVSASTITAVNSTFDRNSGSDAALSAVLGTIDLRYSVVTRNLATFGIATGGGINTGTLIVQNSVIAQNRNIDGSSPIKDIQADTVQSLGNNLIGVAPANFAAAAGDQLGTVATPIDPRLGPLDDYGGPVPTRAPFADSRVINAGSATSGTVATDARGFARLVGPASDIGAFEVQPGEQLPVTTRMIATINPAVNNAAAVNELINFFVTANTNGSFDDQIVLFPGGKYTFNIPADRRDGGTALPVLTDPDDTVTIAGNGATFFRPPGAPSFRFVRAAPQFSRSLTDGPTLVINDMTFDNGNVFDYSGGNLVDPNVLAVLSGGAVRVDNSALFLTDVTFNNNTSTDNGGAVGATLTKGFIVQDTFTRAHFNNNYAGGAGGAVYLQDPESKVIISGISFADSTFTNNVSLTGGGAVHGKVAAMDFDNVQIVGNKGDTGGVSSDLVFAIDTAFLNNASSGAGASAVIATRQMLTLINSAVVGNTGGSASAVGQAQGLAVELLNTTVHGNTSAGPAVLAPQGEVVLSFATVTNNRALVGNEAGVAVSKNILTLYASVVAGNRVTNILSSTVDVSAPQVRNHGFNFVGVSPLLYPADPTDQFGFAGQELDPKLAPVGFYGGPVPTRPPAAGSPLLNRGGVPTAERITADARGLVRVVGGSADIGAFELQPGETVPAAETPLPLVPPRPRRRRRSRRRSPRCSTPPSTRRSTTRGPSPRSSRSSTWRTPTSPSST